MLQVTYITNYVGATPIEGGTNAPHPLCKLTAKEVISCMFSVVTVHFIIIILLRLSSHIKAGSTESVVHNKQTEDDQEREERSA